jgi:hypothetical protein
VLYSNGSFFDLEEEAQEEFNTVFFEKNPNYYNVYYDIPELLIHIKNNSDKDDIIRYIASSYISVELNAMQILKSQKSYTDHVIALNIEKMKTDIINYKF